MNNLNAATLLDSDVDQVTDDTDEEELVIPNILQAKPKPGNMPPAELCFAMYRDREPLGLLNICLLLNQMIVLGPSNAVTERQIKAMNNIKTTHRSSLGQTKLNNQYKIATSSERGKKFNAQKFVDHYVLKSIAAKDRDEQITLQCGTKVPNVFHLKSTYKSNRSSCGNTKDLPEQGPAQKKVKVGDIVHVTIEVDDNDANLKGEELAIINEQLRQDELSHTPNEGDRIREDILHSHVQFMEQFSETVKSCFGSNIGVLNSLLMHMHEKNIKGYEFQVSDLKRMLSGKMYRDNSLSMYNKVMEERSSHGNVPKKVFFVPIFWFSSLSTSQFRCRFLDDIPDLDEFDWICWKLNVGNWHWVAIYHSPAPGSILFYWDSLGTAEERIGRMADAMGENINKVAEKLDRVWVWKKPEEGILGLTSLVSAPCRQGNDCGAAINELGRRLMFGESVTTFDLAAEGKKLRARQASEILALILTEGL